MILISTGDYPQCCSRKIISDWLGATRNNISSSLSCLANVIFQRVFPYRFNRSLGLAAYSTAGTNGALDRPKIIPLQLQAIRAIKINPADVLHVNAFI